MSLYNMYRRFVSLNCLLSDGYDYLYYVKLVFDFQFLLSDGYDHV